MKRADINTCEKCGASVYAPWRLCEECLADPAEQRAGWFWVIVIFTLVLATMWFTSEAR